uniref:Uncharacterized protein n=1 Tax=Cannabis sativa TaxID=3483 RepID=A0A803Q5W7_CANSA
MGRVSIVKEAAQQFNNRNPEVGEAEVPVAHQRVEIPYNNSKVEKAVLARRMTYKTCTIFFDSPLGSYDIDRNLLNRLGEPSVIGVDHALIQEASPGGGHAPDMDDDVPLSWIARDSEKRERALLQCLAFRGTIRNTTLRIRPRGQSFAGPTRLLPTSRGKGKAAVEDYDESSSGG